MKILIVSSIPAVPSWGTAMIYYRHFCQRNDFTISVITDDTLINNYQVPYNFLLIKKSKAWTRISLTRFYKLPHTLEKLIGCIGLPADVIKYANDFKPDAILTMAGSWTWMAILAKKVARKLDVPLIGCFYDWWYYNVIYHSMAEKLIESTFRRFYKQCDLAICISDGMQKELGKHKNSIVLYPLGPVIENRSSAIPKNTTKVFNIAYTGNLGEWYGIMLESLVIAAKGFEIRFKIFGNNPSWTREFNTYVKEENIYMGHISVEQLKKEMQDVDGLILLMGFDESCAVIETTSFKSKFMDYLSYQKPIMLWGPAYSSAVVTAKEFNSAEICTSPNSNSFVEKINKVKNDPSLQQQLVVNAGKMYQDRFHPDKVHNKLKENLLALLPLKSK